MEHYTTYAEAEAAGWLFRPPPALTYRGWYVITTRSTYKGWRLFGRSISGKLVVTNRAIPPGKRLLGHGLRMSFQFVYLDRGAQPADTNQVRCDECLNMLGYVTTMPGATRKSDWIRASEQVMRLVDIRLDGVADIDLIE